MVYKVCYVLFFKAPGPHLIDSFRLFTRGSLGLQSGSLTLAQEKVMSRYMITMNSLPRRLFGWAEPVTFSRNLLKRQRGRVWILKV
jgi:hypothetical protein